MKVLVFVYVKTIEILEKLLWETNTNEDLLNAYSI